MSGTKPRLRCRWRNCPSVGRYADAKTLFEHLTHAHAPGVGRHLVCRWVGCKCKSSTRGTQGQSRHFRVHAGYRPYGCARRSCGASFCVEYELKRHVRRCTAPDVAQPQPALAQLVLGLQCRWAGCARAFTEDAGGAALLAAHLAAEHCEAPCQWAGCVRKPRGPRASFKTHVLSHLPEWHRPFACSACGETYNQPSALTRHQNAAIGRNGCPKRRGAPVQGEDRVSNLKRRKLDEHAADMLPPSSPPPSIGSSSPLTSLTFSPPPPPESSSPPSSSPPPEQEPEVAVALDITNAALHSRLLSAEKLIGEMQAEMDALRRAVQSRLEYTQPSERDDDDFDWSLDD